MGVARPPTGRGSVASAGRPGKPRRTSSRPRLDETDRAMASHATRRHPTRATQGPDRRRPGVRVRARSSHRPVRKSRAAPPRSYGHVDEASAPALSGAARTGDAQDAADGPRARARRVRQAPPAAHQRSRWAEPRRVWRTREGHAATRGPLPTTSAVVTRTGRRADALVHAPCWSLREIAAMRDTLYGGSTTCRVHHLSSDSSPPSRVPAAHSVSVSRGRHRDRDARRRRSARRSAPDRQFRCAGVIVGVTSQPSDHAPATMPAAPWCEVVVPAGSDELEKIVAQVESTPRATTRPRNLACVAPRAVRSTMVVVESACYSDAAGRSRVRAVAGIATTAPARTDN